MCNLYIYERVGFHWQLKNYIVLSVPVKNNVYSLNFKKKGKDKSHKNEITDCVYQISCMNCLATYVGKTKKILSVRINEQ